MQTRCKGVRCLQGKGQTKRGDGARFNQDAKEQGDAHGNIYFTCSTDTSRG